MKQKLLFIFLFFSLFFFNSSNAQDFQWARQFGNTESDSSTKIEVDKDENSYVIGFTASLVFDLDPTPNGEKLIDNTASNHFNFGEVYLSKLDKDGNFLWGKTFGIYKSDEDQAVDVKIGTDNTIYVLFVLNEMTKDGVVEPTVTIVKFSPDGNELSRIKLKNSDNWAAGRLYASSFDLDNQNNIYISGIYRGNVRLHPSNPDFDLNSSNFGQYLLKIASNGDLQWKKTYSHVGFLKALVAKDQSIQLVYNNAAPNCEIYNLKSTDGSIIWKKELANQGAENFSSDLEGNIIISGIASYYVNNIDVDPSSNVVPVTSRKYFLWLDKNGNYKDVKEYDQNIFINSIKNDSDNNVFFAGSFLGTLDADPSASSYILKTQNDYYNEGLLMKFDSNRNFESAFKLGEEKTVTPPTNNSCYYLRFNDLVITKKSQYFVGNFAWDCDLNPSSNVESFNSLHNQNIITYDGFILKLGLCNSEKPDGQADQYFCSNKNATINNLAPNSSSIKWYESETSTAELTKTTSLIDGKIYYASQKTGDCPESIQRLAVKVHITASPATPAVSNLNFCKIDNPKIADIIVSGQNIKWYNKITEGDLLSTTTLLQDQTTYFITQTINGCESNRYPVLINVKEVLRLTITSPQKFCIQQNATLNTIQVTGQNIKWYDAQTAGNLLPNATLLQNDITYYASQTINGCESERTPVTITIQNTLAPTGNATQQFCTGQNPTIANIEVTGTAIKWYDTLTNGTLLAETTNLVNGKTYYASQTINSCEGSKFGVTISILNTPSVPTANANQTFCKNENATLSNIQISGQNIKWYDTNFSASTLPNNTVLEDNKTYYASQTIGCEGDRIAILIRVYDTAIPTGNSNQQFCIDEKATIANLTISGTNIKWYDSATGQTILPETTLLQSKVYYATQTLNNCESKRLTVSVKIEDLQAPIVSSHQTFCIQQKAKISDIPVSGQNIKWFDTSSSNSVLPTSTLLESRITYYVSETIGNCESARVPVNIHILEATDSNCINFVDELSFPKFFTPNGDGYNDYWTIDFAYLAPNTAIRIFDRYGKFIKELNKNTSWDGNYLGQEQPGADYWFIVTRSNGKEFRGHFALKR
ncbi:T9SS type B sorting domain-containing protein [Flavobacterium sp. LHD-80]|uniref:T9SS type B sorting domain-containing protein n=1 Tax=Flavobacterium sp. LHD-80 TaxID=3071411 RepID=UPI0027E134B9|nr:T9SS type B sorting domain-containing protein [Flavobacterium sp. LHD-80]MDQ6470997.1 T9SS type B sorting domain-containing protein [Flavobacterium sp. LHD-80]